MPAGSSHPLRTDYRTRTRVFRHTSHRWVMTRPIVSIVTQR